MWDAKSVYPRIETGYTPDMNNELVEKFNNQTLIKVLQL